MASLCALRLLRLLPREQHHTVAVIGFASPAFGNTAVAAHVEAAGWAHRFTNYLLPGSTLGIQSVRGACSLEAGHLFTPEGAPLKYVGHLRPSLASNVLQKDASIEP